MREISIHYVLLKKRTISILLKAVVSVSPRHPYACWAQSRSRTERSRAHEHGDKKAQRRSAGRHGLAQPILLAAAPKPMRRLSRLTCAGAATSLDCFISGLDLPIVVVSVLQLAVGWPHDASGRDRTVAVSGGQPWPGRCLRRRDRAAAR